MTAHEIAFVFVFFVLVAIGPIGFMRAAFCLIFLPDPLYSSA